MSLFTLPVVQSLSIRRGASPRRGRGYKGFCDTLSRARRYIGFYNTHSTVNGSVQVAKRYSASTTIPVPGLFVRLRMICFLAS